MNLLKNPLRGIPAKSFKPYLFEFLGSTLPQLVGIGVSSVMVRYSGTEVYGQYSMLLAIVTLVWGIFCTAVDQDFQRTCDPVRVFAALSDKVVAWVFLLPAMVGFALWSGLDVLTAGFFAIGMLLWHTVQSRVVRDRIRGRDIWSVLPRVTPVMVFFALLFVFRPAGIRGVSLLFMVSWTTGLVYSFGLCRGVRFNVGRWFTTARRVWPIWTSVLITQAYGNLDLYIISSFHTADVVGVYKIAYTFAGIALPPFTAFCYVYLTKVSSAVLAHDAARIDKVFKRQLALCAVFAVGLLGFMALVFPYVAGMLYGPAGEAAVLPAQLLSIAMVFNTFTMVYSFSLLSMHKERYNVALAITRAVFYLGTSFFLIRSYGATGAGIAMALAYMLFLGAYHVTYKRALKAEFARANGA